VPPVKIADKEVMLCGFARDFMAFRKELGN